MFYLTALQLLRLLPSVDGSRMKIRVWKVGGMVPTEKKRNTWRNISPSATVST